MRYTPLRYTPLRASTPTEVAIATTTSEGGLTQHPRPKLPTTFRETLTEKGVVQGGTAHPLALHPIALHPIASNQPQRRLPSQPQLKRELTQDPNALHPTEAIPNFAWRIANTSTVYLSEYPTPRRPRLLWRLEAAGGRGCALCEHRPSPQKTRMCSSKGGQRYPGEVVIKSYLACGGLLSACGRGL